MNEIHVQQQITMPASLMHAIEAACNSDMSPVEKYEATILICHGYGLWEQQTSFDPTSYAIPESQWQQIGEHLLKAGERGDIAAVNLMLSFMNQGPSGYKEALYKKERCPECGNDHALPAYPFTGLKSKELCTLWKEKS